MLAYEEDLVPGAHQDPKGDKLLCHVMGALL